MNDRERAQQLRDDQWRGEQAKQVLNNPLVIEYFKNARGGIVEKLEESDMNDTVEKELVRMLKVLSNFERDFKKKIRHGEKAKSLLERLFK